MYEEGNLALKNGSLPAYPDSNVVLSIRNLSKSFGTRTVLRSISLDVRQGEFVAILGPSGTGKSTMFRCITRLTEPDHGTVRYENNQLNKLSQSQLVSLRRSIGFVFQQFNLVKRMSAIDNVLAGRLGYTSFWRVMARRFSAEDRQIALECLDSVGILEHAYKRVDGLSGGQQQRVAIARALAQDSHIIIADEPIASLDPESSKAILNILRSVAKDRGIPVVCCLHQVELALQAADRVIGIYGGRVVVDSPADQYSSTDHVQIYGRENGNGGQHGAASVRDLRTVTDEEALCAPRC